jgi:hypothetical protein
MPALRDRKGLTHPNEYPADGASHVGFFRSMYDPYLSRGRLLALDVVFIGGDDLIADIDALIADIDARPGNQLLDVMLILSAEGAAQNFVPLGTRTHDPPAYRTALGPLAVVRLPRQRATQIKLLSFYHR